MGKRRPTYRGAPVRLRVVGRALLEATAPGLAMSGLSWQGAHPSHCSVSRQPSPAVARRRHRWHVTATEYHVVESNRGEDGDPTKTVS
jgi:hypothetical protein